MAHYFCIAIGMADCTPNSQDYHCAADSDEMRAIIKTACDEWDAELSGDNSPSASDEFFAYEFKMPREGENNYAQRLRIANDCDWVLDVIGMTADDWARETEDLS